MQKSFGYAPHFHPSYHSMRFRINMNLRRVHERELMIGSRISIFHYACAHLHVFLDTASALARLLAFNKKTQKYFQIA